MRSRTTWLSKSWMPIIIFREKGTDGDCQSVLNTQKEITASCTQDLSNSSVAPYF